MGKRIPRLLAVLLVAGAVAGGAYGSARHVGGGAGYASDLMTIAPAGPALSLAPGIPLVWGGPTPTAVAPAPRGAALVAGINAQRVAAGLPPLQSDPTLAAVARERSGDMAQRGYFGHVSPTGETYASLMQRQGVTCSWCGENIAYNTYPDDQTVGA